MFRAVANLHVRGVILGHDVRRRAVDKGAVVVNRESLVRIINRNTRTSRESANLVVSRAVFVGYRNRNTLTGFNGDHLRTSGGQTGLRHLFPADRVLEPSHVRIPCERNRLEGSGIARLVVREENVVDAASSVKANCRNLLLGLPGLHTGREEPVLAVVDASLDAKVVERRNPAVTLCGSARNEIAVPKHDKTRSYHASASVNGRKRLDREPLPLVGTSVIDAAVVVR